MSRAWIAFYMGDYQKKTQHLTTEQHGAYFLLLQHCWTHGAVPIEETSRAAIARLTPQQWKKVGPVVNAFFDVEGKNKRASEEIAKAEVVSTKRALAGQKGGMRSGISKAIRKGTSIKPVANAKQMLQQTPQQKDSICEANHTTSITSSFSEAEAARSLDGSLATALPSGALREPSRSASLKASAELTRNLAAKGLIILENEGIPEFLRRS